MNTYYQYDYLKLSKTAWESAGALLADIRDAICAHFKRV